MTQRNGGFSEKQRAELRDAMARSRLAAQDESRRLAALGGGATGAQPVDGQTVASGDRRRVPADAPQTAVEPPKRAEEDVLSLPAAQPILERIAANVDPDYPHRAEHIAQVAAVVVKAKMQPTNAYAKPTLRIAGEGAYS